MKTEWRDAAQLALVGDSRVYRGLDPRVFTEALGVSCLNFGFSSVGFDDRYLDAIEKVVAHQGSAPMIVIGLTTWSLTPRAVVNNGFIDAEKDRAGSLVPALWHARFDSLRLALAPLDLDLLISYKPPARASTDNYIQIYHRNGWVESDYRIRNVARGLEVARTDHQAGNQVDPRLVRLLTERVARWRSQGWLVFLYFPPVPPEVDAATSALSGFDRTEIVHKMKAAGAILLDASGDFETYDGSHLTGESAQRLSAHLAAQIGNYRNPPPAADSSS